MDNQKGNLIFGLLVSLKRVINDFSNIEPKVGTMK